MPLDYAYPNVVSSVDVSFGTLTTNNSKSSEAILKSLAVTNANAAIRYLQFFNSLTASGTPIFSFPVPAGTAAAPGALVLDSGWFSNGVVFPDRPYLGNFNHGCNVYGSICCRSHSQPNFHIKMSYISSGQNPSLVPLNRILSNNNTSAFTVTMPAGSYIQQVLITETAGHTITGGLKIGTTLAGVDVAAALAVNSSSLSATPSALVLKQVFSASSSQTLYCDAVVSWNSASLNLEIIYGIF